MFIRLGLDHYINNFIAVFSIYLYMRVGYQVKMRNMYTIITCSAISFCITCTARRERLPLGTIFIGWLIQNKRWHSKASLHSFVIFLYSVGSLSNSNQHNVTIPRVLHLKPKIGMIYFTTSAVHNRSQIDSIRNIIEN